MDLEFSICKMKTQWAYFCEMNAHQSPNKTFDCCMTHKAIKMLFNIILIEQFHMFDLRDEHTYSCMHTESRIYVYIYMEYGNTRMERCYTMLEN